MIKKAMQPPVCAPKVEWFILKPEYWIKKIGDAEKLILNEEEIIEFNKKFFRKMKSKGFEEWLYDLETYPEIITGQELLNIMKTYSSEEVFPGKICYDINAKKISKMAKKEVFGLVGIDSIAGPSEVLIIANETANPAWLAADMLSQAEHAPGSALLFTDSAELAENVLEQLKQQVGPLSRAEEASKCLEEFGGIVVFDSIDEAIKQANYFASEHLQIQCGDESKKIAHMAIALSDWDKPAGNYNELRHLGEHVRKTLHNALDAFARMDVRLALEYVLEDEKVDLEYEAIIRQLMTLAMENPTNMQRVLHTIWAARALERIGDHATNICEYVIYAAEGKDVRHESKDQLRKAFAAYH